jgi:hypothetical protein
MDGYRWFLRGIIFGGYVRWLSQRDERPRERDGWPRERDGWLSWRVGFCSVGRVRPFAAAVHWV